VKIGILSQERRSYSTRRLVETGRKKGHTMQVIETMRCYMNITSSHPMIRYRGSNLCDFDAIIPIIGASITFYGSAVVRQFESMGVFCVNKSALYPVQGINFELCSSSPVLESGFLRQGMLAHPKMWKT